MEIELEGIATRAQERHQIPLQQQQQTLSLDYKHPNQAEVSCYHGHAQTEGRHQARYAAPQPPTAHQHVLYATLPQPTGQLPQQVNQPIKGEDQVYQHATVEASQPCHQGSWLYEGPPTHHIQHHQQQQSRQPQSQQQQPPLVMATSQYPQEQSPVMVVQQQNLNPQASYQFMVAMQPQQSLQQRHLQLGSVVLAAQPPNQSVHPAAVATQPATRVGHQFALASVTSQHHGTSSSTAGLAAGQAPATSGSYQPAAEVVTQYHLQPPQHLLQQQQQQQQWQQEQQQWQQQLGPAGQDQMAGMEHVGHLVVAGQLGERGFVRPWGWGC